MNNLTHKFRQFWGQEKSLSILLIILVVQIFIIIPIGQKAQWSKIIFLGFYISLLSAGLFLHIKNTRLRIALITFITLLLVSGSGLFFRSFTFETLDDAAIVLYCIFLSWIVLLQTFKEGPITIHRIQGSIVVYLLISFIFGILYHIIAKADGGAFHGLKSSDRKELMYFSLVTLTTMGYGDITPILPLARSLTTMEALVGQLYPAILIARLVSMEFDSSRKR
ncbi:potassium channel family protein [Mucilaginibacter sp. McL0603]|uniref:potassium channel family protein n=1 Tax=Mucilaginibacter sp. McL0603 TaxID=3415670 RepID=UPI003CEEF51E